MFDDAGAGKYLKIWHITLQSCYRQRTGKAKDCFCGNGQTMKKQKNALKS